MSAFESVRSAAAHLTYMQMRCARCNHMRGSHTEHPQSREAIGTECRVCAITRVYCGAFVEPNALPEESPS